MSAPEQVDVAVVGAGLAGLAAARRLAEGGADVVVLEASDRVGGRTVNEPISESEQTEMGGQWVGPTQDRVLALIEELGLETFPTRTEGQNVIEIGGRLRRYRGTIPKLSPHRPRRSRDRAHEARAGGAEGRSRRSVGSGRRR